MGGFWPKMNANGRLDTCELNVFKTWRTGEESL